jgi:hypothetical protein
MFRNRLTTSNLRIVGYRTTESHSLAVTGLTRYAFGRSQALGELERLLPDELKDSALATGNELVLPYGEALAAIVIATKHQIAVLGLDAFEVRNDGLQTVYLADASSHILFTGDWRAYVAALNSEAERWLKDHRLGENHGYILTSTSEREFAANKARFR